MNYIKLFIITQRPWFVLDYGALQIYLLTLLTYYLYYQDY